MDNKNLQARKLQLGCYSEAEGICEVCLHASTGVSEYSLARSDRGQKPEETTTLSQKPRDRIRLTKKLGWRGEALESHFPSRKFPVLRQNGLEGCDSHLAIQIFLPLIMILDMGL